MTPERQEANRIAAGPHFWPQIALIAFALVTAVWPATGPGSGAALAATTERIVTNRYSGLAIEGFDPLSYFVDGHPEMGAPEFEAAQGGVVWRFRNEGNRASFVAHPDIYAPQFGGYDPGDLARAVTVAGNPLFWLIAGSRLYLFAREENRDAFAANPTPYLKVATVRGPTLEEQLAQ